MIQDYVHLPHQPPLMKHASLILSFFIHLLLLHCPLPTLLLLPIFLHRPYFHFLLKQLLLLYLLLILQQLYKILTPLTPLICLLPLLIPFLLSQFLFNLHCPYKLPCLFLPLQSLPWFLPPFNIQPLHQLAPYTPCKHELSLALLNQKLV